MVLPVFGNPLSLQQIQTEFGGTNPIALNEYYAGGANVPSGTVGYPNGGGPVPIPTSGTISINNFYGAAKQTSNLAWNSPNNFSAMGIDLSIRFFNTGVVSPIGGAVGPSSGPTAFLTTTGVGAANGYTITIRDIIINDGATEVPGVNILGNDPASSGATYTQTFSNSPSSFLISIDTNEEPSITLLANVDISDGTTTISRVIALQAMA